LAVSLARNDVKNRSCNLLLLPVRPPASAGPRRSGFRVFGSVRKQADADRLRGANPQVRNQITPDPMRHLITAVLPKRMVDKIIAKRLGLMPPT